jgi:hypothetical protein
MRSDTPNRNNGRYWRLAFSNSWAKSDPWSLSGRLMPYIGYRKSRNCAMWTLGPIAVICIEVLK